MEYLEGIQLKKLYEKRLEQAAKISRQHRRLLRKQSRMKSPAPVLNKRDSKNFATAKKGNPPSSIKRNSLNLKQQ